MRIADIVCGCTIMPIRNRRHRTWPCRVSKNSQAGPPDRSRWPRESPPCLTVTGRHPTAASQALHNRMVDSGSSLQRRQIARTLNVCRMEQTYERPTNHSSRSRDATLPRDDDRYCQRVSDICVIDVFVSVRSQFFAAYLAACHN